MKKTLSLIFILVTGFCLLFPDHAQAGKLYRIRFGYYPEKIRVVFDIDDAFSYRLDEAKEKIVIHFLQTEATADIENYVEISDLSVRYLEVEKEGEDLRVTIPLREPIPYNIFYLNDPPRLVVDFDREFTNILWGGTIVDGLEFLTVSKGTTKGRVNAQVLKVDLSKVELVPALARKRKLGLFESFINTFNPWKEKEEDHHFYRAPLSDIAEEQGALAAVNGTYFAYTGKPLGTLFINKELVSTSIYDRTAFILSEDNKAFIDNIFLDCYFVTPGGIRYEITGVNQGRGKEAVIMYTPAWGDQTGTNQEGIELLVVDSQVKEIKVGNASIPKNGYVLSISGPAAQFIPENIKVGDKIETHIKVSPYATYPKGLLHLISGGPRLVKNGMVYISKYEEKFRSDVAAGRAARTAVGITKEGKVLLVTVDGLSREKSARSEKSSIGMTLEELSELMINLGAVEAMNLDGGSSTTMWVDGRVVNSPVNGYQQKISNALIVRPRL
jgi:hypothetical protein